jgi:hypothetical protein
VGLFFLFLEVEVEIFLYGLMKVLVVLFDVVLKHLVYLLL